MIGHMCSHGHVTGRSHLITCVLTVTCASDEQVRHTDGARPPNKKQSPPLGRDTPLQHTVQNYCNHIPILSRTDHGLYNHPNPHFHPTATGTTTSATSTPSINETTNRRCFQSSLQMRDQRRWWRRRWRITATAST